MLVPTKLNDLSITGAYSVSQISGNTVSLAAASNIARIRWAPAGLTPAKFAVVTRIKVGWAVQAAVTAATQMDMQAIIARGFSVDFTTAITKISMAAPSDTNKTFQGYQPSGMGVNGPGICTTATMSGQTMTTDAAAFANTAFTNQPSGNATVTQAIGVGHPAVTLYEWTAIGAQPVILSPNEGVILQNITAGPVTGAINYYVQWEWVEAISL